MHRLRRHLSGADRWSVADRAASGRPLQRNRLHRRIRPRARYRARLRRPHHDCRRPQGSFHSRPAVAYCPYVNGFLIVRLGSLGDVVHGIPVAAALRHEFPNSRVDWMVDPRYVELLDLVKGIDRRIGVDPRAIKHGAGRQRFRETLRELRDADYDAVIDLQGLLKSAMLARSVRGRRTIGFPHKHLREKLARLFYTEAPDPGDATHVIYKNLALLTPLKVVDRRLRFPLDIPHTPTVMEAADRFAPDASVL